MSPERFGHLLAMVAQFISKNDTRFRKCISAVERLAATLRFFATGDEQQVLHIYKDFFMFCILYYSTFRCPQLLCAI